MKTQWLALALVCVQFGVWGSRASADEDHPTLRAMHRYAHRKVVRASNAVYHAGAHYRNWKHRKGHKIRAWLNKH